MVTAVKMELEIVNRPLGEMILDIYSRVNVKVRGARTSIAARLNGFGRDGGGSGNLLRLGK
jgi:hypothetical protein